MIITCEECSTGFQLDDARVPEDGIRVRCSRCKHAFFVKPESAGPKRVEDVVEEALAQEPVSPGSSQKLSAVPAVSTLGGDAGGEDIEESDWKFNTDPEEPQDHSESSDLGLGLDSSASSEPTGGGDNNS